MPLLTDLPEDLVTRFYKDFVPAALPISQRDKIIQPRVPPIEPFQRFQRFPSRPVKRLKPLISVAAGHTGLKPGANASRHPSALRTFVTPLALGEDYFTFFTFSQRPVFADFSTESVT